MLALWAIREAAIRHHGSTFAMLCNAVLRFLQFVGGFIVLGMYYALIKQENQPIGNGTPPSEMMALIVGGISAFAAFIEGLPWIAATLWIIDAPIFLAYVVIFGIYGIQFIPHPMTNPTERRTQFEHAMWFACANMTLWGVTLVYTFIRWNHRRRERKLLESTC